MKGYFVPPLNARYRFYMACDDNCLLDFAMLPNDRTNATRILSVYGHTRTPRGYWEGTYGQNRTSEWFSLEAGKAYYIESWHIQHTGSTHFSVAVEIEQNTVVNHTNSLKEVQEISIKNIGEREKSRIIVRNPDSGSYKLTWSHPTKGLIVSNSVNCKGDAEHMRVQLRQYYIDNFGSEIAVNLVLYNSTGNVTTNAT